MTIRQYMKRYGWQNDCGSEEDKAMNVEVYFINNEQKFDETQFSINAYDVDELDELFSEFCKENGLKRDTVYNIVIVEVADTIEKLS